MWVQIPHMAVFNMHLFAAYSNHNILQASSASSHGWLHAVYSFLCYSNGQPPSTIAEVLTRILALTAMVGFAFFASWEIVHMCKMRAAGGEPEAQHGPVLRTWHTTLARTISFISAILGAACAFSVTACIIIRENVEPAIMPVYTEMAIRFGIATVLQVICLIVTIRWTSWKEVEDAIKYTIIPAVYDTLHANMPPEETDKAFLMVMPIIDRFISGSAWNAMIGWALNHPELDGSVYLRLVLNVVYSPNSTQMGAPYAVMFSEPQRRIIDLIKMHVFKYPSADSPWQFSKSQFPTN